jgi:hypothetical protein
MKEPDGARDIVDLDDMEQRGGDGVSQESKGMARARGRELPFVLSLRRTISSCKLC